MHNEDLTDYYEDKDIRDIEFSSEELDRCEKEVTEILEKLDNPQKTTDNNNTNGIKSTVRMITDSAALYKPLSAEKEKRLLHECVKYKNNEAKDALVLHNQRYVLYIAKKYYLNNKNVPLEDIYQNAIMGLLLAIDKYDESKGYKLLTYATANIRLMALRSIYMNKSISITDNTASMLVRWERLIEKREIEYGRPLTSEEKDNLALKEIRGCNCKKTLNLMKRAQQTLQAKSLNTPAKVDDGTGSEIIEYITENSPGEAPENMEDLIIKKLARKKVREALEKENFLNDREKLIVWRAFLTDEDESAKKDIACALNLSTERVRQIQREALAKLSEDDELWEAYNSLFE